MGRNRTANVVTYIVRLSLLLLAVFISIASSRADGSPPRIITLTPVDIDFGRATLRAEVNPNGLPTEVEFFIDDYIFPPSSYGKVAAGNGTAPTVVKLAADFPTSQDQSRVFAVASSNAGSSSGYPVNFDVRGVWPFPSQPPPPRPSLALISVQEVTERSAIVEIEVNPVDPVYRMIVSVGVEWVLGTRTEQVRVNRTVKYASAPVRLKFLITGLWRGFTYRSIVGRAKCFHSETGPPVTGYLEGPALTTLGEPGHNPPEFEMRGLRVPVGALRSYLLGFEPSNPEGGTYVISAVSQPSKGTASIDGMTVTYAPLSTYTGRDQFAVTVTDSQGDSTTRVIQVYAKRRRSLGFDFPLSSISSSEPVSQTGRFKLRTTISGLFTGEFSIDGTKYRLQGRFDHFHEATVRASRAGAPQRVVNLNLLTTPDGEMSLDVRITSKDDDSVVVGAGQLQPST